MNASWLKPPRSITITMRLWRWRFIWVLCVKSVYQVDRLLRCRNCLVESTRDVIGHDGFCAPCRITNHMRLFHPDHPTFWKEPHA